MRCSGYYETPCLHVYHKECLLKWLKVRLECPVCRNSLPKPFEYDGAATSFVDDSGEYLSDGSLDHIEAVDDEPSQR